MPTHPPSAPPDGAGRDHGFSLSQVGWGHREFFARRIAEISERGLIGPERAAVTATFFSLLRQADQGPYDHVLRHFLGAITLRNEWLLGLPAVFAEAVALGGDLASSQPHRGVVFFSVLTTAGFGQTPEQVHRVLTLARRVQRVDADLCLAFIANGARLAARLQPADLERFVDAGLAAFARNPHAGLAFMQGALENAAAWRRGGPEECSLRDVRETLTALARALTGEDLRMADLDGLPAADVAERGCHCVLLGRTLYLPARDGRAATRQHRHAGYTLATVVAAGTLRCNSFSRIHGQPGYPSLQGLVGADPLALNALLLAEWHRVLSACRQEWPGVCRLLQAELEEEFMPKSGGDGVPAVARALLLAAGAALPEPVARLADLACACGRVVETAALLTPSRLADLRRACPELGVAALPPWRFMPDYLFPARGTPPSCAPVVLDGRRAAAGDVVPRSAAPPDAEPDPPPSAAPGSSRVDVLYDEWSQDAGDYRRGHCRVQETRPVGTSGIAMPAALVAEAARVRRAFERLQPAAIRREKYRRDGDEISVERLLQFIVEQGVDPAPRVDFYEKPRVCRREVAVLLLLDVSGSTGEPTASGEHVLDLERRAALVLGQGLAALGDRFAVCGFNSAGPRHCAFLVFKDFAERWDGDAMARLQAAVPAQRTRIGPALRHAGRRLGRVPCRQRLILLITDGRPTDSGYDPVTRYAHSDVRKACAENARLGVHTFAVSTAENSRADLEAMLPGHRFVILPDLRQLPRVLATVYSRLTL